MTCIQTNGISLTLIFDFAEKRFRRSRAMWNSVYRIGIYNPIVVIDRLETNWTIAL